MTIYNTLPVVKNIGLLGQFHNLQRPPADFLCSYCIVLYVHSETIKKNIEWTLSLLNPFPSLPTRPKYSTRPGSVRQF